MRICILNEFFYPDLTGGTGTVLSELAEEIKLGYPHVDIDVITSRNMYRDNGAKPAAFEDWNGIKITRLPSPNPAGKGIVARLFANFVFSTKAFFCIVWRKYDVLLVTTAPPTAPITALLLKWIKGLPYVYTVYDLEPDRAFVMQVTSRSNPVAKVLSALQKQWLKHALKIVVLGRCMQEYVSKTYDLPLSKFEVIPIGADEKRITMRGHDSAFRKAHNLHSFVVLYSGNFGRYHNFDTILDAAKQLHAEGEPITFVLVGGGAQEAKIIRRIRDEKIGNVVVLPFVALDDYSDLLSSANVSLVTLEPGLEGVCVPSKFYSILASGRPTIAMMSATSEVARVLSEADCGIQIDQGATWKLVETLKCLYSEPERLARMGENARNVLLEKYTTAVSAEKYYEVFGSTLISETALKPIAASQVSPVVADSVAVVDDGTLSEEQVAR